MTYIENALYDFIKSILTRGVRTLRNPRYLPYSIFLVIIVGITTLVAGFNQYAVLNDLDTTLEEYQSLLLSVEIAVAVAFIVVGLFFGRIKIFIQILLLLGISIGFGLSLYLKVIPQADAVSTTLAGLLYLAWIIIASISSFSLIRDLFSNEILATILFLGKPEDDGKVLFSLLGWLFAIINFGIGIVIMRRGIESNSTALTVSGLFILFFVITAVIPLLHIQRKYDVFYTIITTFFMFSSIRILILAYRSLTSTPGQPSYWDTLFALFIILYTIQNAAVRGIKVGQVESDQADVVAQPDQITEGEEELPIFRIINTLLTDRGVILVLLGTVIGFHTMQVQTIVGGGNLFDAFIFTEDADFVILGYEMGIIVSFLVYVFTFVIFLFVPPIRGYLNPEVKRIPWAPPYEDMKLLVSSLRDGEIAWKGDVLKLISGMGMDKLRGRFGGGAKSEDRMKSTLDRLIGRAKEKQDKE